MIYIALYAVASIALSMCIRHHFAIAQRLNDCNWQAWVLIDIMAAFVIFWPIYIVGIMDHRPGNGLTISGYCGRAALFGQSWAVAVSSAIDALFFVLTSQKDHCYMSYVRWSDPLGDA